MKNLLRKILLSCLNKLDDKNHHSLEQRLRRLEQVIEVIKYPQELSYIDNFKPSTAYKFCDWFVNLFRKLGRKEEDYYLLAMATYFILFGFIPVYISFTIIKKGHYLLNIILKLFNFFGTFFVDNPYWQFLLMIVLTGLIYYYFIEKFFKSIFRAFSESLLYILMYVTNYNVFLFTIGYSIYNLLNAHAKAQGLERFDFQENRNAMVFGFILFILFIGQIHKFFLVNIFQQKNIKWNIYQLNFSLIPRIIMSGALIIIMIHIIDEHIGTGRQYLKEIFILAWFTFNIILAFVDIIWAEYEIDKNILKRLNKK